VTIEEELASLGVEVVGDTSKYREDFTHYLIEPRVVVKAKSVEDIVRALMVARRNGLSVTPWGGGTSLGGALYNRGGMILDMSQMNHIIDFDDINWVAHVEAGVVLDDLNRYLGQKGFFFPPDPASSFACTVGGAVVMGSGGMRCVKYGTMKDWVLALKVVLSDGTILILGEPLFKNRAGYDLVRLVVGSEGTLAIVVEAWLKVIPLPKYKVIRLLASFEDNIDVAEAIVGLRRNRIQPEIAEYMDFRVLRALSSHFNIKFEGGAGALLLDIPEYDLEEARRVLSKAKVRVAQSEEEAEELYRARAYGGIAVSAQAKNYMVEDIVVPISKLPDLISTIRTLEDKYGLIAPTQGHIGDGNLHPEILFEDPQRQDAQRFYEELCEYVVAVGGSITGEHGVGLQKKDLLRRQLAAHNGDRVISLMRKIKAAFDPDHVLNPGKYIE
jgi:glycolate oxidase